MNNGYTEIDGKFYQEVSVVMLSTLSAASLGLTKSNRLMLAPLQTKWQLPYSNGFIGQHLYFLSNEEIKEGDWATDGKNLVKWSNDFKEYFSRNYKKIIATTDSELHCDKDWNGINIESPFPKPSNSFIEKFVSEWNKGSKIDKVLVEYFQVNKTIVALRDAPNFMMKVAPDNTITIKPVIVDKLEQLANLLTKYDVRKYLNINDFGYSLVEREIVKLFENK